MHVCACVAVSGSSLHRPENSSGAFMWGRVLDYHFIFPNNPFFFASSPFLKLLFEPTLLARDNCDIRPSIPPAPAPNWFGGCCRCGAGV